LNSTNPYSNHCSATKSLNASATKSSEQPSNHKEPQSTAASAFLTYEAPLKLSRVDSEHFFGQENPFAPPEASIISKKSAFAPSLLPKVSPLFELSPLNTHLAMTQQFAGQNPDEETLRRSITYQKELF